MGSPVAKRVDKDVYRIEVNGITVGVTLKLANGQWGLYTLLSETRIGGSVASFNTPKQAAAHWPVDGGPIVYRD